MIELEKVALKNIVVHKDTTFEVEPGTTCIRGQNGSGKSLLFSSIPNIVDGCPPLAKKKDAKVLHNESSGIAIKYRNDGVEYSVKQVSKNNSLSYKISKNDEDISPRTSALAKDVIEKIFPISSDQYYSLVHLTPYRSSILLSGNSSQRKELFESIFKLNISDGVAEIIHLRLNQLKREIDEKEILVGQISELTFVEGLEELNKELQTEQEKRSKINPTYKDLNEKLSRYRAYVLLKDGLSNESLTKGSVEEEIKEFEKNLSETKKQIQALETNRLNFNNNEIINKKIADNKKNIERIGEVPENQDFYLNQYTQIVDEGKELAASKEAKIKEIDQKISEAKNINHQIETKEKLKSEIPEKIINLGLEKYQEKYATFSGKLKNNQSVISKLKSLEGEKVCPTCGQTLNPEEISNLIQTLTEENEKCNRFIIYKEKVQEYFSIPDNLEFVDVEVLKQEKIQIGDKFDKKLSKLREQVTEAKVSMEKAKQIEALQTANKSLIKGLVDCEPVDENKIKELSNEKFEIEGKISGFRNDLKILTNLEPYNDIKDLNVEELEEKIGSLETELGKLNDKISELTSKIAIGNEQNGQITKKKDRISEIDKDLEQLEIYQALDKAYSAKGIRVWQIKHLAELYCANLNKFKNLVFNKEIEFSVNVDSTNFNIMATRNNCPPSDVCMLSGSESRCFMLLSLLSLLPFIPPSLRTDFVVLDEMEAGISEVNRKVISQNFFRTLQEIIPKVIVVTPMTQQEFYIEGAREYKIHLENNASVIEKVA